jgi:hypothetical protein
MANVETTAVAERYTSMAAFERCVGCDRIA